MSTGSSSQTPGKSRGPTPTIVKLAPLIGQRPADTCPAAARTPLPVAVADHATGDGDPRVLVIGRAFAREPVTHRAREEIRRIRAAGWRASSPARPAVLRVDARDAAAHRGDGNALGRRVAQAIEHRSGQPGAFRSRAKTAAGVDREELIHVAHGQRPQRHGVRDREHGRVGADAERDVITMVSVSEQRAGAACGTRSKVLDDHAMVLPRRVGEDAAERFDPEREARARAAGIAVAIDEDERELAAILVTKRCRIEREQRAERARAECLASAAWRGKARHQWRDYITKCYSCFGNKQSANLTFLRL